MDHPIPQIHPQDTVRVAGIASINPSDAARTDTPAAKDTVPVDTIPGTQQYTTREIEAIFERADQRAKTIDSLNAIRNAVVKAPPAPEPAPKALVKLDSSHIILAFEDRPDWPEKNILSSIRFQPQGATEKNTDFFLYESVATEVPPESRPVSIGRKRDKSPDWFLGIFIIMLFLLARIRLVYGKFMAPILVSMVNSQLAHNLFRNKNMLYERANIGFTAVFILSASLFAFQVLHYFDLTIAGYSGFRSFLILVGLISLWYLIRYIITMVVGFISQSSRLFQEYFHTIALSVRSIGLILIPIVLVIAYLRTPHLVLVTYLGFALIIAGYLLRVIRLFNLFITKRISVLYSILYLCALEILPILVLYRLVFPIGTEI